MPLTSAAIELLLKRWRDDVILFLLTVTHPTVETIRLVRNNETIISRGETFTPAPFDITLPPENEQLPSMSLRIPNVDRSIGRAIMSLQTSMEVTLEAVFASDTDSVWKRISRLELSDVSFDALVLSGSLSHRRVTHEPFPNRRIIPTNFPAYFR